MGNVTPIYYREGNTGYLTLLTFVHFYMSQYTGTTVLRLHGALKERKEKEHLYSAFLAKALRHGSHSFTCK